ncbi:MAG TPA: hypothetical protein DDZ89_15260 [Clostridiales bacterium]|nr:hypothetical protein [Clostridiales bacterium]
MRKKSMRFMSLFIILAIIFSFAACTLTQDEPDVTTAGTSNSTGTSETTGGSGETTAPIVEENPFAEFYEISWIYGACDTYDEGAYDEVMLEEKYNIDFQVWNISYYDAEGLSMMLAAGDIPDFGNYPYAPYQPWQLYDEGFTRSIPLSMYKQYFPFYYEQMEKSAPSSFKYNNIPGTEEYYGISFIMNAYQRYYNLPIIRLDWLENVGYEISESDLIPVTMSDEKLGKYNGQVFMTDFMFEHEELNDIFRAFTEDDPDGNGEDDTFAAVIYPHTFRSPWVDVYWGQFGVNSSDANFLYLDDATGDVVPYYAYTGYRDYMVWANDMRNKGYMRTVEGEGTWVDLLLATWATGKVGYFNADSGYFCRPDLPANSDRNVPQSIWYNGLEDATFVAMPALKGVGDVYGSRRYQLDAFADGKWRTWTVASTVTDGKLARMLTIWNDYKTDPTSEFNEKVFLGIEGVHFTWMGEPYKSARVVNDVTKIPPQYRRGGWWNGMFNTEFSGYEYEAYFQYVTHMKESKWVEKYCIEPYKYMNAMYMGTELYDQYAKDWAEVSASVNAAVADFANRSWNGEIANINAEWEQYINQLYSAGLETLVEKYFNNEEFPQYQPPQLYDN